MRRIVAVNNHVVVELLQEIEELTDGGLIIPETVINKPQGHGRVISIGSQVTIPVSISDIVIFHKNGGMDIMLQGNKIFKVLKEPEVYAKLEEVKEQVS